MATAPACSWCRGKFALPGPGVPLCEVCCNLHRLENLVRGPRFPAVLQAQAARALHACHLQLLQFADNFYSQAEGGGSGPAVGAFSGAAPGEFLHPPAGVFPGFKPVGPAPAPVGAAAPEGKGVKKEKTVKKEKSHKAKSSSAREPGPKASKERKKHRSEEDKDGEKPAVPIKHEPVEEDRPRHGLVDLKRETLEEAHSESFESESPVAASRSRSKSPLPRRPPLGGAGSQRPPSPPGPPPPPPFPAPHREEGRGESRWEGPIPAGSRRRAPESGEGLGGLAPKYKPSKKKKKNKGVKKKERQRERQERLRQG